MFKYRLMSVKKLFQLLMLTSISYCFVLNALAITPNQNANQTIKYWKSYIIQADQDPYVAEAQQVFSVLLRAWDNARIEPSLYIVESSLGPWAASLADGNILMSRNAIETIKGFGKERSKHLLAFILAHELAHQRSDDLWHQRFFRLIDSQDINKEKQTLSNLKFNRLHFKNIVEKEIQADRNGLLIMNSVGYDPFQVLDKNNNKDFFTKWVENIWKNNCPKESQLNGSNQNVIDSCAQAKSRALRARIQLTNVATQSMLYQLGVQAFAANNFTEARRYFTAYGRDNSNRAVLSAIGLSYLAQARELQKQLIAKTQTQKSINFYYPLLLDSNINKQSNTTIKRSATNQNIKKIKIALQQNIENSIRFFEKAIRLKPNHAKTYVFLSLSYLLDKNTYMVRGILQGKYTPRFGSDPVVDLILAMNSVVEGKTDYAKNAFTKLTQQIKNNKLQSSSSLPSDLMIYSIYYNSIALAKLSDNSNRVAELWQELASYSQRTGKTMLFQMAVSQIKPMLDFQMSHSNTPVIRGKRLSDRLSLVGLTSKHYQMNNLWIEGELHHVYRFNDGSRYIIDSDQKIISAWQSTGKLRLGDKKQPSIAYNDTADRPIKQFGIPDRRVQLMSGVYLAYDSLGVAIQIEQNKVTGWFLYNPTSIF